MGEGSEAERAKPNLATAASAANLHWSHAANPHIPSSNPFNNITPAPPSSFDSSTWSAAQLFNPDPGTRTPLSRWDGNRMKRVADEAITKEHGSTPNANAVQSDSKKMATAAQIAARKIAQPKRPSGRTHGSRATTPTAPSILDQSQQQQQQPSFSFSSPNFQFGSNTASSFPPPTQQSFNFGAPNTATSFTFGQSSTNGPATSNPFAKTNGDSNGGGQHDNNMMMDSSPQKPVAAPSIFQFSTNTQNNASTNGFNFGQSAEQQQTTGGFGSNLFSQSKPQEQTPNTNLFGQMSQPQQNGVTAGAGLFGQGAQANTSAPSTAPLFSFSNTSTPIPSSAPKSEPLFKFGEASASQPAASQPEQSKSFSGFSFGQSSSFGTPASGAESTPPTSKPLFQFGQPTPAPAAPSSTTAPPQPNTGLFASKTSEPTTAPTSSNLFGRVSQADDQLTPEGEEKAEQGEESVPPKNPFASLFAAKPTDAASGESAKPTKSPFKFGEGTSFAPASKPSDTSSKSPDLFSKSTQQETPKPGFNFGQPDTSSGGLFSPGPSLTLPSNELFNLNKATSATESTKEDSTDLFTKKPAASNTPSSFDHTPEPSSTSKANLFSMFGQPPAPSPVKTVETTSAIEDGPTPNKKRALFSGTSAPAAMAQAALGSFAGNSAASKEPALFKPSVSQKPAATKKPITRPVSTEGAPQIPRHLSGDKYKSYDENYRLRNLNRLFRNKIAELDVDKFDVINLIQNYLDHRESIGEGLGRYARAKAGIKRKATDVDDLQEEAAVQGKKSKPSETQQPATDKVQRQPAAPTTTTTTTTTSSSLFSSLASPKPSNTFSPSKTSTDSQTSNLFRTMIPSASSSSTTSTNIFTNAFSSSTPKSTTPPSSPPKPAVPQMPKFEVPKFGGGAGAGNFMAAFAKASAENAKKFEEAAKEKRRADEFDSDEDDAEEWEKKYEEEQRAKKAKIDALAKGGFTPATGASTFKPVFSFDKQTSAPTTNGSSQDASIELEDTGNSESGEASGSGNSGDDEQVTDDLAEDEVDNHDAQDADDEEVEDEEGEPIPELDPSQSLFGRITRDRPVQSTEKDDVPILQPAANNSFKSGVMFGSVGKSTPDAPSFSPLTPANNPMPKGNFVPTTTFNYTPTPASVSAKSWNTSSVLGGGAVKDGPIPGEGLFGSRPSTPQPSSDIDAKSTSVFGASKSSSTPSDNTWKRGSEIKFGTSSSKIDFAAPSVEVTSATPPPKEQAPPFASLFGQSTDKNTVTNGAANSLGFNFGTINAASSTAPAPGFLSAALHFGGGTASGTSSRATSPGIATDNESVATDNTEDYSNEPQAPSLMTSNAGEEEEDPIYESKANIYQMFRESDLAELEELKKQGIGRGREKLVAGWNIKGSGNVRVLQHRDTKKCRIVFRAEPNANILMNARLLSTAKYTSQTMGKSNGAVQFPIMGEDKKMQTWMFKVKNKNMADEMAKVLEENKAN